MKKSIKYSFTLPNLLKLLYPESVDITEKELNPFKWEYKVWTLFEEKSKVKCHPSLDDVYNKWNVQDIQGKGTGHRFSDWSWPWLSSNCVRYGID